MYTIKTCLSVKTSLFKKAWSQKIPTQIQQLLKKEQKLYSPSLEFYTQGFTVIIMRKILFKRTINHNRRTLYDSKYLFGFLSKEYSQHSKVGYGKKEVQMGEPFVFLHEDVCSIAGVEEKHQGTQF